MKPISSAINPGVDIDLVRTSSIRESMECFGNRFLQCIYTDDERAYARSEPQPTAETLPFP